MTRTARLAGAAVALAIAVLAGAPASGTTSGHDTPSPTPSPTMDHSGHAGHGAPAEEAPADHDAHGSTSTPTGPSDDTRLAVLGGFGAVNVAALGTALVLRRRDRRSGRPARRRR